MQDTIIANVVNVTNMTKIWHWLLDGKLQNVNSEDLHDPAKELHRLEDCGRATYSRPRSLAAAGQPASGQGPAHSPPAAAADGPRQAAPEPASAAGGEPSAAATAGGDPPAAAAAAVFMVQ